MTPKSKRPPNDGQSELDRDEPPASTREVDSRELLDGAGELLIRHEGRLYRLRRTRLGKLILTA